jgi:putative oxidoreductase
MDDPIFTDLGLIVIRVVVGGVVLAHGLQKFGYLEGPGQEGTAGFFEGGLGFRPGWFWALVVGVVELVGGALIVAGLLGPIGPLAIAADLAVAALVVHWPKGFWATNGGIEFPLVLSVAAVGLAITGFGGFSLDALLGIAYSELVFLATAAAVIVGAGAALMSRSATAGSTES